MANRDEEHDELTEEQRISMLEKNVTTNKVVLLVLALTLIVAISVTITTAIISSLGEEVSYAEEAHFLQAQQEIADLKKQLAAQQKTLLQLNNAYPELRALINNSSAPTFQKILIEQENSYQQFLASMKQGMYDLSHMVPGSRTWLEDYNEKMNQAAEHSLERERTLKRMNTGKVLIEPDF